MEDRKPLTPEDVARLRAEGKAPLSHVATRLLIVIAVIVTAVSMAQEIPAQLDVLRALIVRSDADVTGLMLSATVKLVAFSSISVIVVAFLATLAQTVGMIRTTLIRPRIRWFSEADGVVATLAAFGAAAVCGGALWYGFGGEVFKACLQPLSQGIGHLVSTVSHGAWVLAGLLFVIALGAIAVARWRFRYQRMGGS
jgi:flagellar biosynthesis protein FlhB